MAWTWGDPSMMDLLDCSWGQPGSLPLTNRIYMCHASFITPPQRQHTLTSRPMLSSCFCVCCIYSGKVFTLSHIFPQLGLASAFSCCRPSCCRSVVTHFAKISAERKSASYSPSTSRFSPASLWYCVPQALQRTRRLKSFCGKKKLLHLKCFSTICFLSNGKQVGANEPFFLTHGLVTKWSQIFTPLYLKDKTEQCEKRVHMFKARIPGRVTTSEI